MATLTAKGQKLTSAQQATAQTLISVGVGLHAPKVAIEACIFDAIMESTLGENLGWNASNPTYGGVLAGNVQFFGQLGSAGSPNVTEAQARSFYLGGNGYQAGGAITAAKTYSDPAILGPQVTAPFDSSDPPPYGQYLKQGGLSLIKHVKAEAIAIVTNTSALSGGGVFGLGGTGTPSNQAAASAWVVGDSSNPDQDYWTTITQYAQNAQWYAFSDGETLVIADGIQIMGQQPTAVIVRTDPRVLSADLTYDNTSFTGTHTHIRKGRVQRRAALQRVPGPTEVELKIICDIDKFRAGDVVYLKLFGPADGLWLIGDCVRSVFQPYSTLTCVQAMQPINATSGLPLGPSFVTGKQASKPGAGTVIAAMISEATTINNAKIPYEYGGGRQQIGTPDKGFPGGNHVGGYGTPGFDCSGVVCAVLNAGGLWPKQTLGSDEDIISTLKANQTILPGAGSGEPECTLYDNPGVHIFMRLNGQIFGTSDGGGTPTSGGGSGGAWLTNGPDTSTFTKWHIPAAVLGQQATQVTGG